MSPIDFREQEAMWMQFFHIIRDQFPYCKMRELRIVDGAVVSFKDVQHTFIFGRGVEPPQCLLPGMFDEPWQRFMRFCQALQNGVLGEVHFSEGRPAVVSMQQSGMDLSAWPASRDHSGSKGGHVHKKQLVVA